MPDPKESTTTPGAEVAGAPAAGKNEVRNEVKKEEKKSKAKKHPVTPTKLGPPTPGEPDTVQKALEMLPEHALQNVSDQKIEEDLKQTRRILLGYLSTQSSTSSEAQAEKEALAKRGINDASMVDLGRWAVRLLGRAQTKESLEAQYHQATREMHNEHAGFEPELKATVDSLNAALHSNAERVAAYGTKSNRRGGHRK